MDTERLKLGRHVSCRMSVDRRMSRSPAVGNPPVSFVVWVIHQAELVLRCC